MSPLAPGLHSGIHRGYYEILDAVNVSKLVHFDRSPGHAHQEITHPKEPTKAMIFGTRYHMAVLEPEEFEASFALPPKGNTDRRTKEGKASWLKWEEENPGKEPIDPEDWFAIHGMRDRLFTDPVASAIFRGMGANEVTVIFIDPTTGLLCKERLDRICEWDAGDGLWTWIVDLKSIEDARFHGFTSEAKKLNYGPKLAFYHRGCEIVSPRERRALWIAQEKKPPYDFMLYEAMPDALAAGRSKCDRWLWLYKEAMESGLWRGYPKDLQQVGERDVQW